MPCRIRETSDTSLAIKLKGCGCDLGFYCSHSKSRSSHKSYSSSSLTRRRSSSKAIMYYPGGFACPDDADDFYEMCIGLPPSKHAHFGGKHYYAPSIHYHEHHHGQHSQKQSSREHFSLGDGECHTMSVQDMTNNGFANDRGVFYTISFPLWWKGSELLKRLTSNNKVYAVKVRTPFGGEFELEGDTDLKRYLFPCEHLDIVQRPPSAKNHVNHVEFQSLPPAVMF